MLDKLKLKKIEKFIEKQNNKNAKIEDKASKIKEPIISENEIKLGQEIKEQKEYISRLENIVSEVDVTDIDDEVYNPD